jgi:UDP-N-acetylglucosamine--N-acetylmuramyl-(pentapeptide) pyrophosphoryl-undecaprenol N-acetylglucosamine transferase
VTVGIAAAGSGGHVYPALAVAEELVSRGVDRDNVIFFGGDRIETRLVPEAGHRLVVVDIHGIRRSISFDNVKLPFKVRIARDVIARAIHDEDVRSMIVFGGYVSGPAALAARKCKIPLIVHEANAVPGVANRLVARNADTVFVAFEPALGKLPRATVIGSPLRKAFNEFDRDAMAADARAGYGVDVDATVLGVIGGSLGASALNELTLRLASIPDRSFEIIHITGPTHEAPLAAQAAQIPGWVVKGYEHDTTQLYAAADLVLARGGALTVAELHATRTPAVIVPLPAGGGYQGLNAADVEHLGGAIVIDQSRSDEIVDTIVSLMADRDRRMRMSEPLSAAPHLSAARAVADRVLEVHHG